MLETSDYPELTRVIRVRPRAGEKPATGFSWGDYEDVRVDDGGGGYSAHADEGSTMASDEADGEDDGWGVVKSRGRSSSFGPATSTVLHPSDFEFTNGRTRPQSVIPKQSISAPGTESARDSDQAPAAERSAAREAEGCKSR
jgi:hypothetical protein